MNLLKGLFQSFLVLSSLIYMINATPMKRETGNTSMTDTQESGGPDTSGLHELLQNVLYLVSSIPILGNLLGGMFEELLELILNLDTVTNGAVTRLLNALLPCVISSNGLKCSGIAKNGGLVNVLTDVINNVPAFLGSGLMKPLLLLVFNDVLNPLLSNLLMN